MPLLQLTFKCLKLKILVVIAEYCGESVRRFVGQPFGIMQLKIMQCYFWVPTCDLHSMESIHRLTTHRLVLQDACRWLSWLKKLQWNVDEVTIRKSQQVTTFVQLVTKSPRNCLRPDITIRNLWIKFIQSMASELNCWAQGAKSETPEWISFDEKCRVCRPEITTAA